MNVIVTLLSLGIIFIIITFFIIAYTSIREYIPGYPTIDQKKELYRLNLTADSMLVDIRQKERYIQNIRNIIEDNDALYEQPDEPGKENPPTIVPSVRSQEDSLLRAEFESSEKYDLYFNEASQINELSRSSVRSINFFKPINGIVTSKFNMVERHYGIDIASAHNETISATLDGIIIYADWTLETGHVIAIQHQSNMISVYKHCSLLLKKQGDMAKAGEPIAISGQSGELATGPHLHFELWHNGSAINPEEYIIFN